MVRHSAVAAAVIDVSAISVANPIFIIVPPPTFSIGPLAAQRRPVRLYNFP